MSRYKYQNWSGLCLYDVRCADKARDANRITEYDDFDCSVHKYIIPLQLALHLQNVLMLNFLLLLFQNAGLNNRMKAK